ncbi:protein NO VEIN domain-containing protein [Streptomyces rishiriensis]|uniref:protein NO VEIN domain-containing protein n=1 Tax=Streptomyces rishiriensis TaxID=68264 RepID=UPI00378FE63A
MTLLPSHGLAFGVLLLAHAAVRSPRGDAASWARAAADQAPFWARSLNLRATAHALARHGLATSTETGIQPSEQLRMLAALESGALQATARVLLAAAPPTWLSSAVRSATVVRDYVPAADLKALAWLEPELDTLLTDAAAQQRRADETAWRERLGAAAEAAVLSALRRTGREAVQVSLVSDAYGYDIEVCDPPTAQIEVKGAGPHSRGSFHLTRHEYETARRRPGTWRLVQVVFHSSAFTAAPAAVLGPAHVAEVLCLTPEALRAAVPEDTDAFVWEQSALLTPPTTAWKTLDLKPAADFSAPGLRHRAVSHHQYRR